MKSFSGDKPAPYDVVVCTTELMLMKIEVRRLGDAKKFGLSPATVLLKSELEELVGMAA